MFDIKVRQIFLYTWCILRLIDVQCTISNKQHEDTHETRIINAAIDIIKSCDSREVHSLYPTKRDYQSERISIMFKEADIVITSSLSIFISKQNDPLAQEYVIVRIAHFSPSSEPSHKWWYQHVHCRFILLLSNEFVKESGQSSCDGVSEILFQVEVYNVIAICTNVDGNILLYTMKPYNEYIPSSWKRVTRGPPGGVSLMKRNYHRKINCKSIFFEQADNKYEIFMTAKPLSSSLTINMNQFIQTNTLEEFADVTMTPDKWKYFHGFDGILMATLLSSFKATVEMRIFSKNVTNKMDEKYLDTKMMGSYWYTGNSDIGVNSRDILSFDKIDGNSMLYPLIQRDIAAIINERDYQNRLVQIIIFFNVKTALPMLVAFGLIFILTYLVSRCRIKISTTNVLLCLFGGGNIQLPNNISICIILTCTVPFFFMIMIDFRSNLPYILTIPRININADSVNDVRNHDYKVYANYGYGKFLHLFENRNCRQTEHYTENCIKHVINNSQVACIDEMLYLKSQAVKYKSLYVMKKPLAKIYTSYPVRVDWPLRKRMDTLLFRLKESGLLDLWMLQYSDKSGPTVNRALDKREMLNYNPISLNECRLLFIFLLLSLIVSIVVFIGELLMSPCKKIRPLRELGIFEGCR